MPAKLLFLLLTSCALLAALFLLVGRDPRAPVSEPTSAPEAVARPPVVLAASERSEERRVSTVSSPSAPLARDDELPADLLTPSLLLGRVSLDGRPPEPGGRVLLRSDAAGTSVGFALDAEGRFQIEGVSGTLTLSFELPPSAGRTLVLPSATVACVPGASTELVLAWRTRHVNLKVIGDPAGWNRARIHLEGAACSADLETDDEGRVGLSLVEGGSFRLEARHPSGRAGSAALELGEEQDLESVVIQLADPVRG